MQIEYFTLIYMDNCLILNNSSENLTNLEDNSLTETQLKEKIKKLEEKNYWLQLENDAIKKR